MTAYSDRLIPLAFQCAGTMQSTTEQSDTSLTELDPEQLDDADKLFLKCQ
jgi:hypothetical protein